MTTKTTTKTATKTPAAKTETPEQTPAQIVQAAKTKPRDQLTPADLEAADALVQTRQADVLTARDNRDKLMRRLIDADETVTAEDLTVADAEIIRAETLAEAAEKDARALRLRAPYWGGVELGEAVARALRAATGMPVTVERETPKTAPEALPSFVVVQSKAATEDLEEGLLTGQVSAHYYAGPFHVTFEGDELARKLAEHELGAQVLGGSVEERDGYRTARYTLNVDYAREELPRVGADMLAADWVAAWCPSVGLVQDLRQRTREYNNPRSADAETLPGSPRVTSTREENGITYTTVRSTVDVQLKRGHEFLTPGALPAMIGSAAERQVGRAGRLGRITAARAVGDASFTTSAMGKFNHCRRDIEVTFAARAV